MSEKGLRPFREKETVAQAYDEWTDDGVLEMVWGSHVHLGYYESPRPFWMQSLRVCQERLLEKLIDMAQIQESPLEILDVGCGIGGSVQWMAQRFPQARVSGITISSKQVERATQLSALSNTHFSEMDAMNLRYADHTFDLVYGIESEPHMPDKERYVQEMLRVLKPGGTLIIASWNRCHSSESRHRNNAWSDTELSSSHTKQLRYLCDEWAHPYFVSIKDLQAMVDESEMAMWSKIDDWTRQTKPSWLHTLLLGLWYAPTIALKGIGVIRSTLREAYNFIVFYRAFQSRLLHFGVLVARKKALP